MINLLNKKIPWKRTTISFSFSFILFWHSIAFLEYWLLQKHCSHEPCLPKSRHGEWCETRGLLQKKKKKSWPSPSWDKGRQTKTQKTAERIIWARRKSPFELTHWTAVEFFCLCLIAATRGRHDQLSSQHQQTQGQSGERKSSQPTLHLRHRFQRGGGCCLLPGCSGCGDCHLVRRLRRSRADQWIGSRFPPAAVPESLGGSPGRIGGPTPPGRCTWRTPLVERFTCTFTFWIMAATVKHIFCLFINDMSLILILNGS